MIKQNQRGQILILSFITLGVVLFTVLFIIAGAQVYFQNASYAVNREKALALAEAGIDKALASLNKTAGTYNGEVETGMGGGVFSVNITSEGTNDKIIESTGYVPNKAKAKAKRTIKVTTSKGVGVAFNYGVQVGEGGLELGNTNTVKGSIYSNGSIIMGNDNIIEGGAWVAAGIAPLANQETDCSGANCADYFFGRDISGQNRLDVAMSFQPSVTDKIRKVSLKIKKRGSPPDETVRIMSDDNGQPKKNDVLATGILVSSLVTEEYPIDDWIDITFSSNPTLSAGTKYWIVIDTSSDVNNYWSWQNDLAQSYNSGQPEWSPNWNTGNPTWNNFSGDLSFKVYMGGTINSITSGNNTIIQGDARANTINGLRINGHAYYHSDQSITNSIVGESPCPNPNCHPGSDDPSPQAFPISQANIDSWKTEAENAGFLVQPTCGSAVAWGPGKFTGDLTLGSNCSVKVKTPIYITGNLILDNSNTITLDSTYGTESGIIVIDGQATLGNSNKFLGTGVGNSILVLLTTYESTINDAIAIGNVGNTGVFYAGKGIIKPGNNNVFKEITAWKIRITNGSVIDYETGLASILFSSGPGGVYSLLKGTYQVK